MWLLAQLVQIVFVELPLTISLFAHIRNVSSVTDLLSLNRLSLRMGGGVSLRYFGWKHFRLARVNTTLAHTVDALAAVPVRATDNQRPVYVRMTVKHYQTDLIEWHAKDRELAVYGNNTFQPVCSPRMSTDIIEWHAKDRELAVYGAHVFQPVCVPRPTTDLIEWRLEDRQLAVYGTSYPQPACLPRTSTDLIVWRLEDRELAVIAPGVHGDKEDEPSVYIPYDDCELVSKVLLLALAVGGAVVDGRRLCRTPATGQGMDKASDLPAAHAAAAGAGVGTGIRDTVRKGRQAEFKAVTCKDTQARLAPKDAAEGLARLVTLFKEVIIGIFLVVGVLIIGVIGVMGVFVVFVDVPIVTKSLEHPFSFMISILVRWIITSTIVSALGLALGVCIGIVGCARSGLATGQGGIKASAHVLKDVAKPPRHKSKTVERKKPLRRRAMVDLVREREMIRTQSQCNADTPSIIERLVPLPSATAQTTNTTPQVIFDYDPILLPFTSPIVANPSGAKDETVPAPEITPPAATVTALSTKRRKSKKTGKKSKPTSTS